MMRAQPPLPLEHTQASVMKRAHCTFIVPASMIPASMIPASMIPASMIPASMIPASMIQS